MTIEERAREYLENEWRKDEFGCIGELYEIRHAYEQGATDQRKIDIEKAWQIIVTEFYNNKRLDKDVFIKAMEEEIWR